MGFFKYRINCAKKDNLTSSIPIYNSFISLYCLISLNKIFSTIMIKSGDSRQPYLIPDFRGDAFRFFSLGKMLSIGLSYLTFIALMYNSSIPSFFWGFIMKGCWICSKAFSASVEMIMGFFVSDFVYMLYYIYLFASYWSILAFLEWVQLDHGIWSF
jgi:hypothetical protein